MSIKEVNIGTRLDIEVTDTFNSDKSYSYVSQLLDVIDSENIVIAAPIVEGRLAFVPNNAKIAVMLKHPRHGLIAFDGILVSKDTHDTVAVYNLNISEEFYKIQRRNNYRLEIMLDVEYSEIKDSHTENGQEKNSLPFINVYTKNISCSGVCIVTKDYLDIGKQLLMKIELPDGSVIETTSVVVRSIKVDNITNTKYNVGVRFLNLDKEHENKLIKFIFMKQRDILKQKRM